MTRSLTSALVGLALVAGVIAFDGSSVWASPPIEARSSDASGVKVVVTPRAVEVGAQFWEFEVVLDTHSQALSEDMARFTVIVDDAGRRTQAQSWEGDGPGHHRKGILRFVAPQPRQHFIEIRMRRVGGADLRTFRWTLN